MPNCDRECFREKLFRALGDRASRVFMANMLELELIEEGEQE